MKKPNIQKYKPYSTQYKNKTKRGYNLSIKDNVVYLNNKKAPVGYKWYDSNNKATYRVNRDGQFEIIAIKGRPIKDNPIGMGSRQSAEIGKFINGIHGQDIDSSLKDDPSFYLNYKNVQFLNDRANQEEYYFIPTYLPNVPVLNVTSGKQYKGIDISANALDSIAKYSRLTNVPLNEFLGITHENTFNKHEPGNILASKEAYNRQKMLGPSYEKKQEGKMGYYPTQLLNNFSYYTNNPWQATANTLMKQGIVSDSRTDGQTNKDMDKFRFVHPTLIKPKVMSKDYYEKIRNAIIYQPQFNTSSNPFINAADNYKYNNYGMGPEYKPKAAMFGDELLADQQVHNYMKSKGYIK